MFKTIRQEFQSLKGQDRNSNIEKDNVGSPMLIMIVPEFQCLKGYGRNSNVKKEKVDFQSLKE